MGLSKIPDFTMRYVSRYLGHDAIRYAILVYRVSQCLDLQFVYDGNAIYRPRYTLINHHNTVVPVMNGHPRDQAKVSVHCRWPLIRGNLTLKCVGRGIYNVAVQGRWLLTAGVAQGRYYCRCRMC